ncbi:MAG: SDR family NAD(P)-dependent oxidoreductase [Betaproteobacteria bacterium]
MSQALEAPVQTGVAIIGFAARLPGAKDVEEFWRNLRDGVESITFFSEEELIAAGVDPAELARPEYVRAKGYMKDAELFDAGFFGYTPREAVVMDPQHRVFLECAWEALENAGYNPQQPHNLTGVFASGSLNTYLLSYWGSEAFRSVGAMQVTISSEKDSLATRVAYKLNLRGPAMTVQTACSSSLTAVSQACQALLAYQCDMALAGGVSVKTPRVVGHVYQEGAIFSPDGHCRAFDARSAGTLTGEGVGIVVLKRLDNAIADGDTIHAVIKGFAVNNDGSNKVGYTAPSVDGQAEVIAMAHAFAGVEPDTITYVEAHGTGTDLGDPIEMAGLTQAFRGSTDRRQFCGVGSVKSNLGHLDAAAGVTGLIKAALALEHREIPPSLHFETPNPKIDFAGSPFYVVDRLTPWRSEGTPRRAGVSAFGIGGTNVHVVLEEAQEPPPAAPSGPWKLLTFSARTESALDASIARIAEHLRAHPEQDLADVAHTLHVGRKEFDWRAMAVCRDTPDALEALGPSARARVHRLRVRAHERPVAFGFTGQGSQYPGMGAGLYRDEPAYREAVDECLAILKDKAGLDLAPVLYPPEGDAKQAQERLRDTRYAQPALFVTEYALARLWMGRGVRPDAMIGHSIGEYVAACLAGVMTLADALVLVAQRGRLMGSVESGSMLAVPLPEAELAPMLGEGLALAAVNAPTLCVASGTHAAIDALEARLRALGIQPTRLHTSHAFHSAMMDPVLEEFGRFVAQVPLASPKLRYVSNVTGDWITDAQATDPQYWVKHLRGTVRFAEGVRRLMEDGLRVFLEVGPGTTLSGLARGQLGAAAQDRVFSSLRAARQEGDDEALFVEAAGRLWLTGCMVDWQAFGHGERRRRVPLPTYPFERSRHWIDASPADMAPVASATTRKPDMADWFYMPSWRQAAMPMDFAGPAQPHRWLVFADDLGLGDQLVARIRDRGESVRIVRAGAAFEKRDDGSFTVAPASSADHDRLFAEMSASGEMPDRVVHLWGVTKGEAGSASERDALVDRCFWSATCVARGLGRNAGGPVELAFVANGVHRVTGDEALAPEKATVAGPCMVAPREWSHLSCRSIDVDPGCRASSAALVERLEAELRGEFTAEPVAYRGGMRWIRGYVRVRIPSPQEFPRLRRNGTYVVTGGLGGIGLAVAEALARAAAARLVLVSRRPFPAREAWDAWLAAHGADDATSVLLRKLLAIEALGAKVFVATGNVDDAAAMAAMVEQAHARFGDIHGVIHSAGVPGGGIMELKSREAADAILAPKVRGTRVLEEALAREPLDFFVLCSSLTATVPAAGQLDYTAANAFQDAFAQSRAGAGAPTIAIEWDAWKETGMAVDTAVPAAIAAVRRQTLETGLATAEGVEAFRRALASALPQVLVSTCDLDARVRMATATPKLAQEESANAGQAPEPQQRRAFSSPYEAPRTPTEQAVAAIWGDLFGIDRMGIHDDFIEADGHSLLAIQIVARIGKELGVKLPVNAIFEYPTIAQLAAQVEAAKGKAAEQESKVAELVEMVERLSDEEVERLLAEQHAHN